MIDTDNVEKAKRLIKESPEKPIIVLAQNDIFNRKVLEYGKFDILLSVERGDRKDSIRQLDSGFNHFFARLAHKNKVALGVDLGEIAKLDKKEMAQRIAKIKQNIFLCKKTGTKIKLINFKDEKDAFAFLVDLGASSKQAKEAISF